MVCAKRTIGQISFLTHPMVLLGDETQVEAHFGSFGDSANLDSRLVHDLLECTIGLEIIFYTPDGIPR